MTSPPAYRLANPNHVGRWPIACERHWSAKNASGPRSLIRRLSARSISVAAAEDGRARAGGTRPAWCLFQRLVTRARFRIRTRFRIRLRPIITGASADFEFAGEALVDPDPAVVVTPRLPANARRLRLLREQPRVAVGIRLTAVIPVFATFARNVGARLRRRGKRGE